VQEVVFLVESSLKFDHFKRGCQPGYEHGPTCHHLVIRKIALRPTGNVSPPLATRFHRSLYKARLDCFALRKADTADPLMFQLWG